MTIFSSRLAKSFGIALGAVVLSTLGLSASDELGGVSSRLKAALGEAENGCAAGTVLITYGTHAVCMDIFEAAPSKECLYQDPQSEIQTEVNIANPKCQAVSVLGRVPWRFVSYTEAAQMCARSGKRLPTNDEWYKVALGLPEVESCVLNTAKPQSGNDTACITPTGVVNTVGNVWEWMAETVETKAYKGRALPNSGYVTLVDEAGVVLTTGTTSDSSFGNDYATVGTEAVSGILRGGFYGSREDGGVFSQNLAAPLNLTAVGVGFRCVSDIW